MTEPVDYINATAAACSSYRGVPIADGYRYLVKFFNCALLDRTQTLQPGFPYRILDPIPPLDRAVDNLNTLCDHRGHEILAQAQRHNQPIHVLWSGGIDSTVALVALLKAAREAGDINRLRVYFSRHSIKEYPRFFAEIIQPTLQHQKIRRIDKALDTGAVIATGELGDQIFGSVLAANYLRPAGFLRRKDERLLAPWAKVLKPAMRQRLRSAEHTDAAYRFLQPQLAQSPIPLVTLFDVLWWVNFSMKWQPVSLRLATYKPDHYAALRKTLAHFFRTDDFQRWSLANHDQKIGRLWQSYKMPLKRYIHDFFPDTEYRQHKVKIPSLGRVGRQRPSRISDRESGVTLSIERGSGDSCADSDGGE